MRLPFLITAAIAFSIGGECYALSLSPDEALARLYSLEGHRLPSMSRMNKRPVLRSVEFLENDSHPAFYIFSDGSHSYFLGADSRVAPLLALIDSPDAGESIPPHVEWFLSSYKKEIALLSDSEDEEAMDREIGDEIYRDIDSSRVPVEPLITTRWNQDYPYNLTCPKSMGINCVTGCVATAMAQVIAYYQWPSFGRGYVENAAGVFDFDNTEFNWSEMKDSYEKDDSDSSWSERLAVAELMSACGVAVNMIYTQQISGAYTMRIADVLRDNFRYSSSAVYKVRDVYSRLEWEEMLYNELAGGRPVLYGGRGQAGGHSFVCDGYLSDGLFHFNWGWGGAYDGYFRISALNPMGLGIGGGSGQFNSDQDAIMGICPDYEDVGGLPPSPLFSTSGFTPGGNFSNKGDRFEVEFTIDRGAIINPSGVGRSGKLGVFLADFRSSPLWLPMSDADFEPIADDGDMPPKTRYKGSVYYSALSSGEYLLYPGFCADGGEPERIRVCDATSQGVGMIVGEDGKARLIPDVASVIPDIQVTDLSLSGDAVSGEATEVDFTLVCGDTGYDGPLYLTAASVDGTGEHVIGLVEIAQDGSSAGRYVMTAETPSEPGSYFLRMRDSLWLSSGAVARLEVGPSRVSLSTQAEGDEEYWYTLDGVRILEPKNYSGILIRRKGDSSKLNMF